MTHNPTPDIAVDGTDGSFLLWWAADAVAALVQPFTPEEKPGPEFVPVGRFRKHDSQPGAWPDDFITGPGRVLIESVPAGQVQPQDPIPGAAVMQTVGPGVAVLDFTLRERGVSWQIRGVLPTVRLATAHIVGDRVRLDLDVGCSRDRVVVRWFYNVLAAADA